jgi:hypothetical protein
VVPEVVHITDDEEEEPMEVEAYPATSSDGSASTPVVVPIPPVDAPIPTATPPPASQAASAPTLVPSPTAPEEPKEMGWTCRNKFKEPPEEAHYHKLLTTMLAEYYPDFAAQVKYYCMEYKHSVEENYWKNRIIITAWNSADDSHEIETHHSHRAKRANAYDSMEDAMLEAYVNYHGRRFYDMQENCYRFLPRHDHEDKTWVVLTPSVADPTMDTTVQHLCATHVENEALKEELRMAQKSAKRL